MATSTSWHDRQQLIAEIIAKAWNDSGFKEKLLTDPVSVLRSGGVDVPDGVNVHVYENTNDDRYFVLPQPPEDVEHPGRHEVHDDSCVHDMWHPHR